MGIINLIKKTVKKMASININGNVITGSSVVISNGRVIINGKDMTPDGKEINITINGDVEDVQVDCCQKLVVTGNVSKVKTTSGDVEIGGNCSGNIVTTSGDVEVDEYCGGYIETTSGDVNVGGNVSGSVKTLSGDIKHRK